ncbi:dentin sialophosphoprotein-like, partial [Polypterus senegalus]|uniref:dentin sialophosphoprotein-like n=1 Tax=Polypterus senegalus TaxID=55291 RepID=UPI001962AA16
MNFSQHDETAAAAINEHPELFIQIDSPIDFDIQDENSVQNQTDSQRDYADLYSHDSTFPGVLTQLLQGSDTLELYKNWEDPEPTTTSQSIRGYSPAASQSSRGHSPAPSQSSRGYSPAASQSSRGHSPAASQSSRGHSPAPSQSSHAAHPPGGELYRHRLTLSEDLGEEVVIHPDIPISLTTTGDIAKDWFCWVMPENGSSGSSKERDSSDSSNDSETDSFRERDSSDSSNDSGTDSFREHPVGRKESPQPSTSGISGPSKASLQHPPVDDLKEPDTSSPHPQTGSGVTNSSGVNLSLETNSPQPSTSHTVNPSPPEPP